MRIIKLLFSVGLIIVLPSLVGSCVCDCDPTEVAFNYQEATITLMDNSGDYFVQALTDTLPREAIAFELSISDTSLFAQTTTPNYNTQGWPTTVAVTCDCFVPFTPNQQIDQLTITELPSGQEVTSSFVAEGAFNEWLYLTPAEALHRINTSQPYDFPGADLTLVLTTPPEATEVQYEVEALLSNGQSVAVTSPTIYLK